ncbi:unnamed protein product [Rhodiola kirilowii]
MDDSCAVCAETLEWVAYGDCGHKEVCSTCVARLRFICEDRRCCICKTESNVVFVTKALGDYTRLINDFSVFPSALREGRIGSYWYHEDTQAIFDDVDHYNMIKAMCRLSCSVCDNVDEQAIDGPKKKHKFRNVEQLKGHLFHQHKLLMCSLCLEGRKVFISEQKLYTRTQLKQHINSGDSEVDGKGSERGGFTGHPMCEFCKTPFYADNELFSHMSTEHYTCHICQRQHPGHYDYFRNYDDLEIHFRREHFLCEDEACLAKKFVVFQFEAEMKRHNTMEHGGRMSRARRNAALQIPTSFRYRSGDQGGQHRGRGRTFRRDSPDNELSVAIQASLDASMPRSALHDPPPSTSLSYSPSVAQGEGETTNVDTIIQPVEALTTDPEKSARYLQAVSHHSSGLQLRESSFPPLPIGPSPVQNNLNNGSGSSSKSTMAANLQLKNRVSIHNSSEPPPPSQGGSIYPRPMTRNAPILTSSAAQSKWAVNNASSSGGGTSSSQVWPAIGTQPASTSSLSNETWSAKNSKLVSARSPSPSKNRSSGKQITHSISAPSLLANGSFHQSLSEFPPVSVLNAHKSHVGNSKPLPKVEDVSAANKALVEKMRAALAYDEEKYGAFKEISASYRQGSIGTEKYLEYVEDFGLSHLVLDLARLCPDAQKQRELLDIHNANMRGHGKQLNSGSRKCKDKKDSLADSVISTVRELQSSYKPSEVDVEVLSKDGYRTSKDKSETVVHKGSNSNVTTSRNDVTSSSAVWGAGMNQNSNGKSKQRKKNSK